MHSIQRKVLRQQETLDGHTERFIRMEKMLADLALKLKVQGSNRGSRIRKLVAIVVRSNNK